MRSNPPSSGGSRASIGGTVDTSSSVPQAAPTPTGTMSDQTVNTAEAVSEHLSSEDSVEYETGPLTSVLPC